MAGNDILPYVRYARASVIILLLSDFAIPFAVLYTKSLYIVGPLVLLAGLFFLLSFVALGYNYEPTEELLDKEEEEQAALECCQAESPGDATAGFELQDAALADKDETLQRPLPAERQEIICEKLDAWRAEKGYKRFFVEHDHPVSFAGHSQNRIVAVSLLLFQLHFPHLACRSAV